jgi:hypothetical protein
LKHTHTTSGRENPKDGINELEQKKRMMKNYTRPKTLLPSFCCSLFVFVIALRQTKRRTQTHIHTWKERTHYEERDTHKMTKKKKKVTTIPR